MATEAETVAVLPCRQKTWSARPFTTATRSVSPELSQERPLLWELPSLTTPIAYQRGSWRG